MVDAEKVWLLNPVHARILEGDRTTLEIPGWGFGCLALILLPFVGIPLTMAILAKDPLSRGFPLIFLVFVIAGFIQLPGMWRNYKEIMTKGELVEGTLVSAKTRPDSDGPGHHIEATYRFQDPSGKTITGKEHSNRRDGADPPPAGTPVAILYVNARKHKML